MYVEGVLVATQNAGAVVGLILRYMCQDGIVLLQLSSTTSEIRHRTHHRNKRLGLRSGRNDDGFFDRYYLGWTARNVIDNVQCGLWHQQCLVLVPQLLTAMSTLIGREFRIAYSGSNNGLDIPITAQCPGVSIKSTNGAKVTLASHFFILMHIVDKELHIGYIVVGV